LAWSDFEHSKRVNRHMEIALSSVHADMYSIIAPLGIKGRYCIILSIEFILHRWFTDGSSGWFCRPSLNGLQYRISDEGASECILGGPCGDPHGYGPNEALGGYLILTDSMNSIKAMESRKNLATYPSFRVRV
jgi:hypothetical protein